MIYASILIFFIGLAIGSFINVVVCRLPENKSVVKGRSHCPHCGKTLKPQDLIPVISFLMLRGRCRDCKKKISWQYPLVELAVGLLFVYTFWLYAGTALMSPYFYRDLVFIAALVIVFMTDLKHYLIFDAVVWPMMFFSVIINLFLSSHSGNWFENLTYLALAGLVSGGFFYLQYYFSKGKWIGDGDIRLGFLMGFMLGWPNVLVAIFFAYIVGAIISLCLVFFGKKGMKSQVPFGVFLTLGTLIALWWGQSILTWYIGLII